MKDWAQSELAAQRKFLTPCSLTACLTKPGENQVPRPHKKLMAGQHSCPVLVPQNLQKPWLRSLGSLHNTGKDGEGHGAAGVLPKNSYRSVPPVAVTVASLNLLFRRASACMQTPPKRASFSARSKSRSWSSRRKRLFLGGVRGGGGVGGVQWFWIRPVFICRALDIMLIVEDPAMPGLHERDRAGGFSRSPLCPSFSKPAQEHVGCVATSLPFDCFLGLKNFKNEWSAEKRQWCLDIEIGHAWAATCFAVCHIEQCVRVRRCGCARCCSARGLACL